jgi:hypothetical protein
VQNTYTYTACSARNPDHMATFTITDHQVVIDPGTSLQEVEQKLATVVEAESKRAAVARLFKPAAIWAVQRAAQPFAIDDVTVKAKDDSLRVRAWTRAGGLRLAPAILTWKSVDNSEAAEQFVAEVEARRAEATHPGKLPGPMDYWLTWLAGALALLLGVAVLPRLLRRLA